MDIVMDVYDRSIDRARLRRRDRGCDLDEKQNATAAAAAAAALLLLLPGYYYKRRRESIIDFDVGSAQRGTTGARRRSRGIDY